MVAEENAKRLSLGCDTYGYLPLRQRWATLPHCHTAIPPPTGIPTPARTTTGLTQLVLPPIRGVGPCFLLLNSVVSTLLNLVRRSPCNSLHHLLALTFPSASHVRKSTRRVRLLTSKTFFTLSYILADAMTLTVTSDPSLLWRCLCFIGTSQRMKKSMRMQEVYMAQTAYHHQSLRPLPPLHTTPLGIYAPPVIS